MLQPIHALAVVHYLARSPRLSKSASSSSPSIGESSISVSGELDTRFGGLSKGHVEGYSPGHQIRQGSSFSSNSSPKVTEIFT
ncbi:hypothetical protein KFK09_007701 [Dendrobium nobile]|uniref:Uncharacterized protein n=1 Tax=Dendrobium nobile TaxID=94219 RepID=A0A8T3BUU4_DENNO|nr:hypothetical protein KFK09_007701 [Dendrobium nobile]